ELFSLESFSWLLSNISEVINDDESKEILYNFLRLIEKEKSMLGISAHILAKARNTKAA
ncbi:MAG: hypothetical protein GXP33_04450, partial [Spirochaetes bacterium]|nr:hypothetical protein [Spirochaetota bacterium]